MKQSISSVFVFLFIFIFSIRSSGQFTRYIIQLNGKAGTPFSLSNPSAFLSQRAIDRRTKTGVAIDSSDLPITPAYIDSIRLAGNVTILNVSKWLNRVCIKTTDANALAKISTFPFVISSKPIAARVLPGITLPGNKIEPTLQGAAVPMALARPENALNYFSYGQSFNQVHLNQTEFLHNHGFRGEGMRMAILDDGFYHYLSLPTFDSVRSNNQIKETWDFVAVEPSVNEDDAHGMNCFSTIAANLPGTFIGTAPYSNFFLYRTEDISSEYPVEEQNWAAAAERADSIGIDVISTSLGYNTFSNNIFDYTYADMNGHTSTIAKAANLAAKKGMAVVVAAGNEGNYAWHYITTPADADSVLTVGATDIYGQPASFSSYGPSSDGQIKPDVGAVGLSAVVADINSGLPSYNNGTSFATPIMAGMLTCLWQAFPELKNMDMVDALHHAGSKYSTPDNRVGYGVPDAKKAFVYLIKKNYQQQVQLQDDCQANIHLTVKSAVDMPVELQRKLPAEAGYTSIHTFTSSTGFTINDFYFQDDLTAMDEGTAVQYRMKMSIASDTAFYLDSATVVKTCTANPVTINHVFVYGDATTGGPVLSTIHVNVSRNDNASIGISLFNSGGQKIFFGEMMQAAGEKVYAIPVASLSRGVYVVQVYANGKKIYTKKIIKG